MRNVFVNKLTSLPVIILAVMVAMSACKKDSDGSPDAKAGNMVANAISPDSAAGGASLTLQGSGLGDIRSIVFEKGEVPAPFYSTLNTESAIIFRVPDTAFGGEQNIIFTNSAGKTATVSFKVLAYASVSAASNYNFTSGAQITLTGNNLDDVATVVLTGTTTEATIVSQSRKSLVITMPATSVDRTTLDITNATGKITTTQEFVNIDNAFQIFTDDYGAGFENGSWGDAAFISVSEYKSGSKSIGKTYAQGNWHLIGLANWWPGVAYDASYKYLTVWVKGASQDYSLYIMSDKITGGYGNYLESNKINVPANVWTYFKIPLTTLNLWATGTPFNQLGFRIQGPDAQDETFYFDDVMLVK